MLLIPALQWQRKADPWHFQASLVYLVSSRPASYMVKLYLKHQRTRCMVFASHPWGPGFDSQYRTMTSKLTTTTTVINQLHKPSFRHTFCLLGKHRKANIQASSGYLEAESRGPRALPSGVLHLALLSPQTAMVTDCRTGERCHPKSEAWDSPPASWQCFPWKEERRWRPVRKGGVSNTSPTDRAASPPIASCRVVHWDQGTPPRCVIWDQASL